jgi:hypothetical protein
MPPHRRSPVAAGIAVGLLLAACSGGGDDVGGDRADQVRRAARTAGLSAEVADVLALAARAEDATFQVAYAGTDGARLLVSQEPPDRRVDVLAGDVVVESRVLHDHVAFRCEVDTAKGAKPGALTCERAAGALDAAGTFTHEALRAFTDQLAASKDELTITVDTRTIADTRATCLTTTPKAGTPIEGTGPGTDVLCLSPEGAQLLVDRAGNRLVADHYSTKVPKGTFDV